VGWDGEAKYDAAWGISGNKGKGKAVPLLLGERSYSSYSLTTSALDESEWTASRPGRA